MTTTSRLPEPLTAEEEADLRAAITSGPATHHQFGEYTVRALLATLDAARDARELMDVERLAQALAFMVGGGTQPEEKVDPGDYSSGVPTVFEFASEIVREYDLLASGSAVLEPKGCHCERPWDDHDTHYPKGSR
jgi:hypothetical protein